MFDKDAIRSNQSRMERNRSAIDQYWSAIARLVYPEMDGFYGKAMKRWQNQRHPGEMGTHDPYAAQALDDGVSVFEGFVMPRGKRWQGLALDEYLMKSVRVQQWVETIERRLFMLRQDPQSGFATAVHQSTMSLFAFGAQSMWIEPRYDALGRVVGLKYESEFIGDIYKELDASSGDLRTHRQMTLTAEQAVLKFGKATPDVVRKEAEDTNGNKQRSFDFLHVVEVNPRPVPGRIDAAGKPIRSCYYLQGGDDQVFMEGGYISQPRVTSNFNQTATTDWGYSPAMRVLPQIILLQEIGRDRALGAELRLKPPLLTQDDELDGAILDLSPFGVTYGGLDDRGNPAFREFLTAVDATDARELAQESRAAVDKAFGRDLLQLNRELKTHITATRTAEELAEKGVLLAPYARQESEWLSPMTVRELTLMYEHGWMDDMPPEVAEYFAENGSFHWRYDNQLSRMIQASDSAAFLGLAEQVGALANLAGGEGAQAVLEQFARAYPMPKVMAVLGENAGVPASMKATEDEQAAFDEAKRQQQEQAALAQAVPILADAAKNTAQAASLEGGL